MFCMSGGVGEEACSTGRRHIQACSLPFTPPAPSLPTLLLTIDPHARAALHMQREGACTSLVTQRVAPGQDVTRHPAGRTRAEEGLTQPMP